MIFRAGFQTFELQHGFELPKPLIFGSREEALKLVKQIGTPYPDAIGRFREYLVRFSDDLECFRLTDHDTFERMAELLYSRKVLMVVREDRSHSGAAGSKGQSTPVAFPLAERAPRQSTVSSQPAPVEDPPTFDPRVDTVAQAAALVAAAKEERALCPE